MFDNPNGVFAVFQEADEAPDPIARFRDFVATFGWTQQQAFRAAYRAVRRAVNIQDADSHYEHFLLTKRLPDYVVAYMNGEVAAEGAWAGKG